MVVSTILIIFVIGYIAIVLRYTLTKKSRGKKPVQTIAHIPGPQHIPLLGTRWIYITRYKLNKIHEAYTELNTIYGDIMKETDGFKVPIVSLYNRLDIEKVLLYPSKYPFRPPTDIISVYREQNRDRFLNNGIVNEQGESWHNLRTRLSAQITSPGVIQAFVPALNEMCDDFIELIRYNRDPKTNLIENFLNVGNLFGLEAVCMLVLGRRLGCLSKSLSSDANGRIYKLANAVKEWFRLQRDSQFSSGLWKYLPTKMYREYERNERIIYEIISDIVEKALEEDNLSADDNDVKSVFASILQTPDLDIRDKKSGIIDFIISGIETFSNTISFMLYYITKYNCQEQIVKEFEHAGGEINGAFLNKCVYTRACIQEVYRINPTAFSIARMLEEDMNLSGYYVKAGTIVLCHTKVACHKDENFKHAKDFLPERWITEDENGAKVLRCTEPGASIVVPFGVGRRACVGKRFAEKEALIVIAKLVTAFDMEYVSDLDPQFEFLLAPKSPVSIIFKDRV